MEWIFTTPWSSMSGSMMSTRGSSLRNATARSHVASSSARLLTEIVSADDGMLSLDMDPKLAWALRNRDRFPLDIATASREDLLRVPGFGTKAVDRIIATRRLTSIRVADLARLHIPRNKALPFIVLSDHRPSPHLLDGAGLAERFKPKAAQLGFGF